MPYRLAQHGSRHCVVLKSTGKAVPGGCHDTRAEALRHLAALQVNVAEAQKDIEDGVAALNGIMAELREPLLAKLRLAIKAIFLEGARLAGAEELRGERARLVDRLPKTDIRRFNDELDRFLDEYPQNWWQAFQSSMSQGVAQTALRAGEAGLSAEEWAQGLARTLGRSRASMIAVTEMTRIMGAGAIARYRSADVPQWQWQTVQDDLVDDVCAERQDQVYDINEPFYPAHPRCRCWPVPWYPGYVEDRPLAPAM